MLAVIASCCGHDEYLIFIPSSRGSDWKTRRLPAGLSSYVRRLSISAECRMNQCLRASIVRFSFERIPSATGKIFDALQGIAFISPTDLIEWALVHFALE